LATPLTYSERPEYKQVVNSTDEEDMLDDEGVEDEREIWEVTHVSEGDVGTTERPVRVRVCIS